MARWLLIALCSGAAGCSHQQPNLPRLHVTPTEVRFESPQVDTVATRTVTLTNAGGGVLVIGATLSPVSGFSLGEGPRRFELREGEQAELALRYEASEERSGSATLALESNDELQPVFVLPIFVAFPRPAIEIQACVDNLLTGQCLSVSGDEVDLGPVRVGRCRDVQLTVANEGDAPLLVRPPIVETGTAFAVSGDESPRTLEPVGSEGSRYTYRIAFCPTELGAHQSTVRIDSTDPLQPLKRMILSGSALQSGDIQCRCGSTDLTVNPFEEVTFTPVCTTVPNTPLTYTWELGGIDNRSNAFLQGSGSFGRLALLGAPPGDLQVRVIVASGLGDIGGCTYAITVVDDRLIVRFVPPDGSSGWLFELEADDGTVCSGAEPQVWCGVRNGGYTLSVLGGAGLVSVQARLGNCGAAGTSVRAPVGFVCADGRLTELSRLIPHQAVWELPTFNTSICRFETVDTIMEQACVSPPSP